MPIPSTVEVKVRCLDENLQIYILILDATKNVTVNYVPKPVYTAYMHVWDMQQMELKC